MLFMEAPIFSISSLLLRRRQVFQMLLPVGEEAVGGRQQRTRLALAQSDNEAADARVGTRQKQLRHLHACRQDAPQVLQQVPDGHPDVRAVAHHQDVGQGPLVAVAGGGDVSGRFLFVQHLFK